MVLTVTWKSAVWWTDSQFGRSVYPSSASARYVLKRWRSRPSRTTGRSALAKIPGVVAWVYAQSPDRDPAWTADPRGLAVRVIQPDDDSAQGDGVPYLIAWLPADGDKMNTALG